MLSELFLQSGLTLSPEQLGNFELFLKIFQEKNAVLNLSGIRNTEDILNKHFLDSLQITKLSEFQAAKTVMDIGTGGGFPGLPLAIFAPEKQYTLVDSVAKKIKAVQEFVDTLKLKNVTTIAARSEDLGHQSKYREQFDLCVSRAVAYLPTLLEYCLPLVKVGGNFIAYKENPEEELALSQTALQVLGGKVSATVPYELKNVANTRHLVVIAKEKPTPALYPRHASIISSKPL